MPDFGLRDAVSDKGDRFCTSYDGTGWFAAGGITGTDVTGAVANGLHMGTVIDNYLRQPAVSIIRRIPERPLYVKAWSLLIRTSPQ